MLSYDKSGLVNTFRKNPKHSSKKPKQDIDFYNIILVIILIILIILFYIRL